MIKLQHPNAKKGALLMYFRPESADSRAEPETTLDPIFLRFFVKVRRFKRLMLCVFLFVMALTGLYVWLAPRKYTSHMKILVTNARPDLVLTPNGGQDTNLPGDAEIKINSEVELLHTTDLMRRVVADCSLATASSRTESSDVGCRPVGTENPALSSGVDEKKMERAVEKFGKDLNVEPVRKTNLIEVSYSSRNPQLSVNVLNTLASSYLEEHLKVHGSSKPYEVFKQARETSANRLQKARLELTKFQQEHPSTIGDQEDSLLREKFETEEQLREATKLLVEDRAREQYAKNLTSGNSVEKNIVTQTRSVPNLYSVQQLNTMLVDLQNRRTELLNKYNADDRLVVQVQTQINTTQTALAAAKSENGREQLTDRNPVYATAQLEGAKARIDAAGLIERQRFLVQQAKDDEARLLDLKFAQTRLTELQQAVAEAQETDTLYQKKQSDSQMTESLDEGRIADVAVVEKPVVSYLPSSPEVGLCIAAGFIVGIIAAIASVLAAELFTSTRRQVELID